MKIVITGAKGQLGNALQTTLKKEEIFLTDLPELNLTSFYDTQRYIQMIHPDFVIHCAAKTQVDDCESNPDAAYHANVLATKNVVNACQAVDAALVYISTDYVFDGRGDRPYREYDPTNPQSVYGKTKCQGERIIESHLQRFYIVRTAWLFGDVGNNIVRTILKLAAERKVLKFVHDQVGCPTYATDLAAAIARLLHSDAYGIYHITNEGNCSWHEFAKEILKQAGKTDVSVEAISSQELNRPAPRPAYSVLARDGLRTLGIEMPEYQDALHRFLRNDFS